MTAKAPSETGSIPQLVAGSLDVFVDVDRLEEPGPTSYHERRGCYDADDRVPWSFAIKHGAEPCGVCCDSFEVDT